jgi:hypothetical protein
VFENTDVATVLFVFLSNDAQYCHVVCGACSPVDLYSSTLKMSVICSSETSGCLQTTRRHNPDDRSVHIHRNENIESNETHSLLQGGSMLVPLPHCAVP